MIDFSLVIFQLLVVTGDAAVSLFLDVISEESGDFPFA